MQLIQTNNKIKTMTQALFCMATLLVWCFPAMAKAPAHTKRTKAKKKANQTGNTTRRNCLTESCPQGSYCVMVGNKPICVQGTDRTKAQKGTRDLKSKRSMTLGMKSKKMPLKCANKHCPPGTRCQTTGGTPQCVSFQNKIADGGLREKLKKQAVRPYKKVKKRGYTLGDRLGPQNAASCVEKSCPPGTMCVLSGGRPMCMIDRGSNMYRTPGRQWSSMYQTSQQRQPYQPHTQRLKRHNTK